MSSPAESVETSFQRRFHHAWPELLDPHVRALAWLLTSPDLLDRQATQWGGRIANLPDELAPATRAWLRQLDDAPDELHHALALHPFTRLGKYAEKLMAFYFAHLGTLVEHGLQVNDGSVTVGEFDFLIRENGRLVHRELATKFYLLQGEGASTGDSVSLQADYFVGPNLADTLGAKMRKILDRQLALSLHPAAIRILSEPVEDIGALIKGWLFYHGDDPVRLHRLGLNETHCRGFWCSSSELESKHADSYLVLDRLQWLAPASVPLTAVLNYRELSQLIQAHFSHDTMPVMVALMEREGERAFEVDRGFLVPDDWTERAGQRLSRSPVSRLG